VVGEALSAAAPSPLNVGPCIKAIVFGANAASRRKVGSACGVLGMKGMALSRLARPEIGALSYARPVRRRTA
jgi:hypothetical protein